MTMYPGEPVWRYYRESMCSSNQPQWRGQAIGQRGDWSIWADKMSILTSELGVRCCCSLLLNTCILAAFAASHYWIWHIHHSDPNSWFVAAAIGNCCNNYNTLVTKISGPWQSQGEIKKHLHTKLVISEATRTKQPQLTAGISNSFKERAKILSCAWPGKLNIVVIRSYMFIV